MFPFVILELAHDIIMNNEKIMLLYDYTKYAIVIGPTRVM